MMVIRRKKTRKLVLSDQNLREFPASVFSDKKITTLDLSNNKIKEIPANIGELTELKYLYLNNNSIAQLHHGILKCKSLKRLYLLGNPMKRLPNFIKKNARFSVITDSETHHYYPDNEIAIDNQGLQEEIGREVDGIRQYDTTFANSAVVPSVFDTDITFCRHSDRKGKSLNTCVLFVDIRDSVQKNQDHRACTLAKMYSAFVYGVLRIAKAYNGHVRNIIGDRVMVVFDEEDCCDNAVRCAGSIGYFCKVKMDGILPNDIFCCGIGIHYGNIKVIEVGMTVKGKENPNYKNLIWIGEPANLASRLTDVAGKGCLPYVIISRDVLDKITDKAIAQYFSSVDRTSFRDVDFSVYGCNLIIK